MMNTRLRTRLPALLAAALLSHQAAAIEEIVVIGTDTSAPTRTVPERILAEMSEYVRAINAAQKSRLDADLAKLGQRKIQMTAANLPSRG
jgi:hypothetical protein